MRFYVIFEFLLGDGHICFPFKNNNLITDKKLKKNPDNDR